MSDPSHGEPDETDRAEQERAAAAERERAAAAERDAERVTVELGASVTDRLLAALTTGPVLVTVLALASAVAVGAVVIAVSDETVRAALGYFAARPADTFSAAWSVVSEAYVALARGALGGSSQLSETGVAAIPLILSGLAVAIPLRAGLINIGGEGQVLAGGLAAGVVGFGISGLPLLVHLPLALLGGLAGGALWGLIPGLLKARTGAHEVIVTIMLNYIALNLTDFLLQTSLFLPTGRSDPISKPIEVAAQLPAIAGTGLRIHAGVAVAVLAAAVMWWLLERRTIGFEINAVGLNPRAATIAGMSVSKVVVIAMTLAGVLGGLAGATQILGVQQRVTGGFSAGLGFDGITVALLGRAGVGGTVAAGVLFGGLKAGGRSMQAATGTSLDLVVVIQALVILFIAAPALVRALYGIRAPETPSGQVTRGWGA